MWSNKDQDETELRVGLVGEDGSPGDANTACALAALLHVNASLNREIEACIQIAQAAKGDAEAWQRQNLWLRRQLIAVRRAKGQAVQQQQQQEGDGSSCSEESLLVELGQLAAAQAEIEAKPVAGQHLSWDPDLGCRQLLGALTARGRAAGWLISPSEVIKGRVLGEGSFGITHEGRWRGAKVAVKCVRVSQATEQLSFLREVEALSSLRHPHVLPFLGACMLDGQHCWLVTEFMEKGTLASWLHPSHQQQQQQQQAPQQWPLPSRRESPQEQCMHEVGPPGSLLCRLKLACEVAQGMEALESLQPPILHRDLKPSNIFIDSGGHARVADFGLARRLLPEVELTGETGTYLYMSPEVMRHEVYDTKADVWSWGVLLIEALTLQVPYAHTFCTPVQIAMSVCEETLSPRIPTDIPVGLQVIAQMALSFDPDQRPSFQLLNTELTEIVAELEKQGMAQPPQGVVGSLTRHLAATWTSLLNNVYPAPTSCS